MHVKGNSGSSITLVDESTIRKSAIGSMSSRLERQAAKQDHFHREVAIAGIHTPKVLRQSGTAETRHLDMEFVAAKDFVQFLTEADRDALDGFVKLLINFVETNLAQCRETDVTAEFARKLDDLSTQGVPAKYIEAAQALCRQPVVVPVGRCHGDLTLSNILFKNQQLYLIDFLDCFVESPLQDVVKLRQDTAYGWSLHLYEAPFDQTKMRIALRYLDQRIVAAFASYSWYQKHYELFQFLNFMRILPYCKDQGGAALVIQTLDAMLLAKKSA